MTSLLRCIISVLAGMMVVEAEAAQIKVISKAGTDCPVIRVKGQFSAGDAKKFETTILPFKKAVVEFASEGGTIYDGLVMGKLIRGLGFWTVVRAGKTCASACAIAWLGGSRRFVEKGAKIGFHAAYVKHKNKTEENGMANAIVGAFLTKLGLNEDAVAYATASGPWQMTWLTPKAAREVGIEVTFGPPSGSKISATDKKIASTGLLSEPKEQDARPTAEGALQTNSRKSAKQIYDRIPQEREQEIKIDSCAQ
jgi:hypothetical protein